MFVGFVLLVWSSGFRRAQGFEFKSFGFRILGSVGLGVRRLVGFSCQRLACCLLS